MARKTEQIDARTAYAAAMDAAAAAVGLSRERDLVVMAKLVALGAGAAQNPTISDVAAQCMWPYDQTRRQLLSLRDRGFVRIKKEDRRLHLSLNAKGWWAIGTAMVAMQAATEKFVARMSSE
jgi:DNA-binding IclR family transcriptional regulator